MSASEPLADSIAAELPQWIEAIPGAVDADSEALRQRIGRLSRKFARILDQVADEAGISVGDWEALSVLARTDPDREGMTPSQIGSTLALTSGTVSVRLERLRAAGRIEFASATTDARRKPVRLTDSGHRAWADATAARVNRERELIRSALDPDRISTTNEALARLLSVFEAEFGPSSRHDQRG